MRYVTKTPIKFQAEEITAEGAEVELTPGQARPLLASGAIGPAAEREPAAEKEPAKKDKK